MKTNVISFFMVLGYSSNIEKKMERGKWEEESGKKNAKREMGKGKGFSH